MIKKLLLPLFLTSCITSVNKDNFFTKSTLNAIREKWQYKDYVDNNSVIPRDECSYINLSLISNSYKNELTARAYMLVDNKFTSFRQREKFFFYTLTKDERFKVDYKDTFKCLSEYFYYCSKENFKEDQRCKSMFYYPPQEALESPLIIDNRFFYEKLLSILYMQDTTTLLFFEYKIKNKLKGME